MKKSAILFFMTLSLLLLTSCSPRPSDRYGAMMIYDSQGKQMILFGGRRDTLFGEKPLNDLWSLDLEEFTWNRVQTDIRPSPRLSPGMIYDPVTNRVVMFGGLVIDDRMNDTWIFDLEQGVWSEIILEEVPAARSDVGFAIDPEQRIAVLFSGHCQGGLLENCDDTWIFDLDDLSWTKQESIHAPSIRYGHSFVFASGEQQFMTWGGNMAEVIDGRIDYLGYGDTFWIYSAAEDNWQILNTTSGNIPQKRYWHQTVFVEDQQSMILFGGDGGRGFLNDIWIFSLEDSSWREFSVSNAPSPRVNGSVACDPVSGRIVLFGGLGEEFNVLGDTWLFSLKTGEWEEVE